MICAVFWFVAFTYTFGSIFMRAKLSRPLSLSSEKSWEWVCPRQYRYAPALALDNIVVQNIDYAVYIRYYVHRPRHWSGRCPFSIQDIVVISRPDAGSQCTSNYINILTFSTLLKQYLLRCVLWFYAYFFLLHFLQRKSFLCQFLCCSTSLFLSYQGRIIYVIVKRLQINKQRKS